MLGVVPGGGDGGGYRLGICNPHHGLPKMPCTCTGRLCPKGVPFIMLLYGRGGISQVELFEREGKSATVNKKYMKRIKNDFKKYFDCKYSKVACFSVLFLGSRSSSAAKDHIEPECAFEVCSDSCTE